MASTATNFKLKVPVQILAQIRRDLVLKSQGFHAISGYVHNTWRRTNTRLYDLRQKPWPREAGLDGDHQETRAVEATWFELHLEDSSFAFLWLPARISLRYVWCICTRLACSSVRSGSTVSVLLTFLSSLQHDLYRLEICSSLVLEGSDHSIVTKRLDISCLGGFLKLTTQGSRQNLWAYSRTSSKHPSQWQDKAQSSIQKALMIIQRVQVYSSRWLKMVKRARSRGGPKAWATEFIHLPSRAATPGKILPSNNSKLAPPPVLMWLILPPRPAWFTALTESPPPITVVAPYNTCVVLNVDSKRQCLLQKVERVESAKYVDLSPASSNIGKKREALSFYWDMSWQKGRQYCLI